jgi:hypothetical protein
MHHARPLGNASLFLLLSSAIAACGGTTSGPAVDAGQKEAAAAEGADSGSSSEDAGNDGARLGTGTEDASFDSGCPGSVPDGDGGCLPISIRRPFLVGSSLRAATASHRADWSAAAPSAHDVDDVTARWLAAAWVKDGLEEHASIAAFARFTMHLLAVGAPPDLIAASQRASLDEIRHARDCFAMAQRYGGEAVGPSELRVHDTMGELSLAALAALTAEEGCVGETLGAALAAEQAGRATDAHVAQTLHKIARDEARHAELAWRFVTWAVRRGGAEVAVAVSVAIARAVTATLAIEQKTNDGIDLEAWHAHGRLTCDEARQVARRGIEDVVRPCMRQLLTSAAPPVSCDRSVSFG